MLFLKMVAESNFRVVADTLEIDRVCRINLNFSNDDCMHMDDGNHSDIQVLQFFFSQFLIHIILHYGNITFVINVECRKLYKFIKIHLITTKT